MKVFSKKIILSILAVIMMSFAISGFYGFANVSAEDAGDNSPFDKSKVFKDVKIPNKTASDSTSNKAFKEAFVWAGIIAVVMVTASGFFYIISSGDSGKIGRAKTMLTYSVIGLLIVIFSGLIVNFALEIFG